MSTPFLVKASHLLGEIRDKKPLIHHITNYVTANDCANIVLAIGASPVMADDVAEVEEMVSFAGALVLNMGTLNERTVNAMLIAGKKANELNIPVILDPVGVGATHFRNVTAYRILNDINLAVIRGNMSEIKFLLGMGTRTKGVDASEQDIALSKDLSYGKRIAQALSERLKCVVAITGATDIIANDQKIKTIENGHPMMRNVTGTGCMCTSLIGAFCAVTKDYFDAASAAVVTMGICGEKALGEGEPYTIGNGTYRMKLLDSVFLLSKEELQKRGRICEG